MYRRQRERRAGVGSSFRVVLLLARRLRRDSDVLQAMEFTSACWQRRRGGELVNREREREREERGINCRFVLLHDGVVVGARF
jgi:hypothetical protein